MSEELKVHDGQVISMEYTLRVDGQVLDSSEGRDPLEYLHGAGNIISGLEREMADMAVGESKNVVVSPADGYGEMNDTAFMDVPRNNFPEEIPLKPGIELQVSDQKGNPKYARIESVGDQSVRLNFNHPLAGKELHFDIKVVGVREATPEEKEHGHVHGENHQH